MPLQSTEGPTTKRPLPGSGAGPAGGSAHNYLALLEARLPVAFYRGRLSGGALRLDSASEPLTRLTGRSEEHTSELQSLMRISYAVFCLKKKKIFKAQLAITL